MKENITNRDFVIVGQQPWDIEIGSNCKNIAAEIARHNRVLYVNAPLDRITAYREKNLPATQIRKQVIAGKKSGLVQISPNLWNLYPDALIESINWIKLPYLFDKLNVHNNEKFAATITKAIRELGFKNIILFNDNDIFRSFYLKEFLKPAVSVYYSRDYLLGVPYWKKHGERLEPQLIQKSDVCVANSTYLADYLKRYNPHSFYVGQGCDLSLFQQAVNTIPEDISVIRKPVIGYVGALFHSRLDIEVLSHTAQTRKDWQLVLVGPEDEAFKNSSLHNLPNVHFLGHKDVSQLPSYIQHFDVCLNPQILNEITIGNYPRKIDEYLAMGKPVVATQTKAMEIFREYVYLAHTKEEYIILIERALQENTAGLEAKRKKFASTHTWENNVAEIYKAISLAENKPAQYRASSPEHVNALTS